ncbi:MAG: hypothetical protein QNJ42_11280 [Crocosphaera sp.]|nr:hypothetical protein [Crocosphaera sp.]
MTRLITRKIMILGLITLVFSIKPILAHTGHDHSKPDTKSTKIEQEKTKMIEENIESSPTTETKKLQAAETKIVNVTLQQTDQFKFIPKTSEIIFLLLVANPIMLKLIKQKLYSNQ